MPRASMGSSFAVVTAAATVAGGALLAVVACHHDSDGRSTVGPPDNSARGDGGDGDPDAHAGETVVTDSDDGKTFDVPVGATVAVRLPSHAGTGYVWVPVVPDGGALAQVGERGREMLEHRPGAPTTDVYRFTASAPGTTTLEMDFERPWEHVPPAKTVTITLRVH